MLTAEQWTEFQRRFPDADAFITRYTLKNELVYLRRTEFKNDWQKSRLIELENLDRDTGGALIMTQQYKVCWTDRHGTHERIFNELFSAKDFAGLLGGMSVTSIETKKHADDDDGMIKKGYYYKIKVNGAESEETMDYQSINDRWSRVAEVMEDRGGHSFFYRRAVHDDSILKLLAYPNDWTVVDGYAISPWEIIAEIEL